MQVLSGILFHLIGGTASGSFYLPFKKVKDWSWESYWIVAGFFSWLIVPMLSAWLTVPHFMDIIAETAPAIIFWTYFMGLLWGIGGLTFGLAMRYLGLSLGMSVTLGFTSVFGALVPPLYRDIVQSAQGEKLSTMFYSAGGPWVFLGIIFCLIGIYICGKAGMRKEAELTTEQKHLVIREFNITKGLLVATISGILSACFNFGIEAGKDMAATAVRYGTNDLFQNNVTFVVLLWGGLTTNLISCLYLNTRNKSFHDYGNKRVPLGRNYFFSALAGTIWFLQFFFYGMGESKLGNGPSSWILHMAFIILVSNIWGILLQEWKGVSRKTFYTILAGIITIIFSVLLVGYGNYRSM